MAPGSTSDNLASMFAASIACLFLSSGWKPIPMVSAVEKKAGFIGGEGAQVILSIANSSDDSLQLMSTDVGGIYRSVDGGKSWGQASVSYWPRGASSVAIDPHNKLRCLAIGANSVVQGFHGPWVSADGAASWHESNLKVNIGGGQDQRDQIAYDPTTFDGKITRTAYWSRVRNDSGVSGNPDIHPAIYRTLDGGETWKEMVGSAVATSGPIRTHPKVKGVVYSVGLDGIYRSKDSGLTWTNVRKGIYLGLDVSPANPNAIWANTASEIAFSTDMGSTWKSTPTTGITASGYSLENIRVSPLNGSHMVLWRAQTPNLWDIRRYMTKDGGLHWFQSKFDNSGAFLPYNVRGASFAWSSKNADIVWSTGGDWPTKSSDGGLTYKYSGGGDNGILVGGMWNFCQRDPNTMYFGSQDYNGAVTHDAGATWSYVNESGNGWGGFVYGGYAVTPTFLIAGNADSWGGPRTLRVSKDGGSTWKNTGVVLQGPDVSFGVPSDPNVAFAKDHRTGDGGATWTVMPNCDGVFATDGKAQLFGRKGNSVVTSKDSGKTWTKVAATSDEVRDIAYDPLLKRIYAVIGDQVAYWNGSWQWLSIPKNQWGWYSARTVAVDPVKPSIVYIGSAGNTFSTTTGLLRSSDSGKTWTNLSRSTPLGATDFDGGHEVLCVRVHPVTREAWVSTSCYGLWKIPPP